MEHGRIGGVENAGLVGALLDAGAAFGAEKRVGRDFALVVETDGGGGAQFDTEAAGRAVLFQRDRSGRGGRFDLFIGNVARDGDGREIGRLVGAQPYSAYENLLRQAMQ